MSPHDSHSSFIQTPQQLILVVLLSFLVPIIGIILVVQLVTSERGADPAALTPEAIAKRIQPVGHVEFGGAGGGGGTAGGRSGEEIVKTVCAVCHQAGVAGAPKIGNKQDWAPRIKQGLNALVQSAIKGKGGMPPKGGNTALSDDEVTRAVVALANQAGAKFKEPAAKAPAQKPEAVAAAPAKPAAADGKKVFDSTCTACHSTGVGGAPKLGDKAQWAPRVKQGMDALVQSAIKGKGAMPPKGGNASLSDDQIRAAIDFMVSQSK